MSDSDTLVFFGLDNIIFRDSIKAKLKEKAEREARIAEKILRLRARAQPQDAVWFEDCSECSPLNRGCPIRELAQRVKTLEEALEIMEGSL